MSDMVNREGSGNASGEEAREKVDRLIELLEGHVKIHRRLVSVLERKKKAMVEVKMDGLEAILGEEKAAIDLISESERDRIGLTDEISKDLGYSPSHRLRLLELINRSGEAHRDSLLDLRDELREIADSMDRLNRLNRTLALHSLEHVHLFLSMLRGGDPSSKIYTKDGGQKSKPESILVDRRI